MPGFPQRVLQYKKPVIALLLAAVLGGGGYYYYSGKAKPVTAIRTVTAERGTITSVVSATGTISPVNSVDVSSKINGRIEEMKVAENERVKTGQVLVVLDDSHLQTQVSQARAKLANSSANYERSSRLAAIGALSQQQLDAAEMDYSVAQAAYDDAVSQLDDTVIRSPIDGIVIGKPIPAGQTVAPGISTPMVILTVADMSQMQISTQVDESDIGKVKVGQPATFTVDAYPDKTFTGAVSNISQKANIQQNVVYYPVLIDVDAPEGLLKPAMTARVSINTGRSPNTIVVPLSALKENKGQRLVQVADLNGQIRNVPVTVGLTSDDQVEILTGLTEGDRIVLPQAKQQQGAPGANSLRGVMGR